VSPYRYPLWIKKTLNGYCHFVKVNGRWKSIPGLDFHRYVPRGLQAEVRIFEYDPLRGRWDERRASIYLWDPETN
jgi:hypothetical protein